MYKKDAGVTIKVIQSLGPKVLGDFDYVSVPRVGEWLLTPDNDGSGDMAWVVDAVVYFPAYPEVPSGIAVHVTAHKVQDLLKQLEGKISGQQSQKTYLQIVEKIQKRRQSR
jgi:hypothetical protein